MGISRSIIHQILVITPVALQNFMIGAGCGWVSPIINTFKNSEGEFSLTDEDCSWIASLHYVGRIIGCLISAATTNRIGRSSLFVVSAILTLLVWGSVALTKRVLLHYAIRFTFGLTHGIFDTTTPIYVGENSSPNMRGVFGTMICLYFFVGELITFIIATYASYTTVATVVTTFALLSFGSTLLLREPAQYLIMEGRETEAKNRFRWLRGTKENIESEFEEMIVKLADMKVNFSPKMFLDRRFRIVAAINVMFFLNGFPAVNSFLGLILVPTTNFTINELTILHGVAQLVGVGLSTQIIERFGRRILWIVSISLCIASHLTSTLLCYLSVHNIHIPYNEWFVFSTVTVYATVFAAFILPLASTARSELLPPQFKAAGICVSVMLNSATGFIMCRVFLIIANAYGMMTNFIIYTFASVPLLVYVYCYLPETKGMTLIEIQKLFEE